MIVIADASPLRYLIEIDCVEILPHLFDNIVIPTAVARELQHEHTPDFVRQWISAPPAWASLRTPASTDAHLDYLGSGEQEAILLASELQADWLILDDAEGRREATRRNLPVLGTLRVLDAAAERKLIDLHQALARLQTTGFHVSPKLVAALLARHP